MAKKGLVAFLDILGYQDIINNNLIEEAAKIVSDILLNIPTDTKKKIIEVFKDVDPDTKGLMTKMLDKIDHRVISDSILLVFEMPEVEKELKESFWLVFIVYVGELLRHSFDKGLPLRGAIDYGDFFLEANSFAGRPIINCYRLGSDMEISGCVLTSNCAMALKELIPDFASSDVLQNALLLYLVPLKEGKEERLWTVAWLDEKPKKDFRHQVIKAFQGHNKDITRDVYSKIDNTEVMLRCFFERLPALRKEGETLQKKQKDKL